MKVSINTIDSMGRNLYSNVAAVLSELVANAWDADATEVEISYDIETSPQNPAVTIIDNGCGMTQNDLNDRFLTVGYQRRSKGEDVTGLFGRPVMGRKGIGKLSVFSIADRIVVASKVENGDVNGFVLDYNRLEDAKEADNSFYEPQALTEREIASLPSLGEKGTLLQLTQLKTKRLTRTVNALRERVARRFNVLHLSDLPKDQGPFVISINGTPITYEDRQDLKRLEYIWTLGDHKIPNESCNNAERLRIDPDLLKVGEFGTISGWIGTVSKPSDLVVENGGENLRSIIVMARNRPIQEGLLDKLSLSTHFASYVTGQLIADFLDETDQDDVATSDRQRLIEDDPRVEAFRKAVIKIFRSAGEQWSQERPKRKLQELLERNSQIDLWIESLPQWQKEPAKKLMGTIQTLEFDDVQATRKQRAQLVRAGVIAFQRIGLTESTNDLEELASLSLDSILKILGGLDSYEATLYYEIIKSRLEVIQAFEDNIESDVLEAVLQQNLYENLWLLDPAWDRVQRSDPSRTEEKLKRELPDSDFFEVPSIAMEQTVGKMAESFQATDWDSEDMKKRIDLRYCNVQNRHVIIELKRSNRVTDVSELYGQGLKYVTALHQILENTGRRNEPYELVFVLGTKPTTKGCPPGMHPDDYIRKEFDLIHASYRLYDELIVSARNQYQEYLDKYQQVGKANKIVQAIEDDFENAGKKGI